MPAKSLADCVYMPKIGGQSDQWMSVQTAITNVIDFTCSRARIRELSRPKAMGPLGQFGGGELITFEVVLMGDRVPGTTLTVAEPKKRMFRPSTP